MSRVLSAGDRSERVFAISWGFLWVVNKAPALSLVTMPLVMMPLLAPAKRRAGFRYPSFGTICLPSLHDMGSGTGAQVFSPQRKMLMLPVMFRIRRPYVLRSALIAVGQLPIKLASAATPLMHIRSMGVCRQVGTEAPQLRLTRDPEPTGTLINSRRLQRIHFH